MSIMPINTAGAGSTPPATTSPTTGTAGSGEAASVTQAASGTEGTPLSTQVQLSLDTLGGLSIRDLLLLFLLSMLEKEEQEEKSSLAPALLLLGAISMQVNLSIQFGEDVGAGGTPGSVSAPEQTGETVDMSA